MNLVKLRLILSRIDDKLCTLDFDLYDEIDELETITGVEFRFKNLFFFVRQIREILLANENEIEEIADEISKVIACGIENERMDNDSTD